MPKKDALVEAVVKAVALKTGAKYVSILIVSHDDEMELFSVACDHCTYHDAFNAHTAAADKALDEHNKS